MTEAKKKSLLKSAAILGIAGLLVQIMGAIFRIPLGNIIGDEGMGYYQTAYPIYVALLVFSTNGAPAAISKMTSERIALGHYREAHRVFRLSFVLMTVMGIVLFLAIAIGAKPIVSALGDQGAYYAMVAIAPSLLFVPILSVFRGYFQGMQDMSPTATSQLVEQAVRVGVGLSLAIILAKNSIEMAAAGATFGTSIGPIFGIIVLVIIYAKRKKGILQLIEEDKSKERETAGSILKTLALIAVPITIGVSIMPIINIGDLLVVMRKLQSLGFSDAAANALYGQLSGMAIPVVNVPMAMALSMALAMVPAVAAANSIGDRQGLENNIRLGFRMSMIIGVPCSFGIIALAEPVMRLLYPLQIESAVSSAKCLLILGFGVAFLCVGQTMAGTLQGIGRPALAVWGIILGFIVKCVSSHQLIGLGNMTVEGAAWGSVLGFMTICIFNVMAVKKVTGVKQYMVLSMVKPIASGIIMFIIVKVIYAVASMILPFSLTTLLAVAAGVITYGIALLAIKAITPEEIEMLPKGKGILRLLKKLKIIR